MGGVLRWQGEITFLQTNPLSDFFFNDPEKQGEGVLRWQGEITFFLGHFFYKITEIFNSILLAISLQTHPLGEIFKIHLTGHFFPKSS